MDILNSHHVNDNTLIKLFSTLNFKQRKINKLKHQINLLDKQAIDLVYDNDAYWENRKTVWNLTQKLIKEVQ